MKKRVAISVLTMTCGLLAGCGGQSQQETFETLRAPIAAAEEIRLAARLQTERTEQVETYGLECVRREDAWEVTVTEPEILAGITARLSDEETALIYGEVMLPAGELTAEGIPPVGAVPVMVEALRDGALDSVWTENGALAAKLIYDDEVDVTVWFDGEDRPCRAELSEQGVVRAKCTLEEFRVERSQTNGRTEETDLGGNQPAESAP